MATTSKTTAKPAAKPAAKPVTKPAVKTAAKPAAKSAPKAVAAKPAASKVAAKPAAAKPAAKAAQKPAAKPKVAKVKKAVNVSKKSRLHDYYNNIVIPHYIKEKTYANVMEVPKIDKIVINMGLGAVKDNSKSFNLALEELALIAGQQPVATLAKQSISNFKIRDGQKIGAKVTLRGERMYEFLDRLISIALPRVRDFKGVSKKAFDGRGNYALGIKEQLVFPEIQYEKVEHIRGFDVIIVTTAKTDKEAFMLLNLMGMPFKER